MLAGVDEVGRGPLAGPVVAAAVILPNEYILPGLTDSKKLSERKRNALKPLIEAKALAWTVGMATVEEIDTINILQATMLAMKRAVESLSIKPSLVLVDGNRVPDIHLPAKAIVKGDMKEDSIAAASILAKVYRDTLMQDLHRAQPEYGFAQHKGYPTKQHLDALARYGATKHHRVSFSPVKKVIKLGGDQSKGVK